MRPSDHLGTGHLATRDLRTRNAFLAIVAGLLILPFSSSATAEPGPLSYANAEVSPGRVVVDDTDPGAEGATIGLETFERSIERAGPAVSAGVVSSEVGQFVACFEDNVPPDIREVAERAIGRWDDALLLTGPSIELDISWTELGSPTTLAASGPSLFVVDDALPQPGIRYPVGLANELTGFDFSPRSRCDTTAPGDVVVYINSRFGGDDSGWHLGTEPPAEDAIDLETVLLHEVGHGLGFLGSAASGGRGNAPVALRRRSTVRVRISTPPLFLGKRVHACG